MDKGLKILEQLQLKLVELEKQDEENDKLLCVEYDKKNDLLLRITSSEYALESLNSQKKAYEESLIIKDKEIKKWFKILSIKYIIVLVILSIILPAIHLLIPAALLAMIPTVAFGAIIKMGINEKYPSGDIAEIERKIEHHNNNVKNLEKELTLVYSKIHDLEEIEKNIETKIDEITDKINSIQKVRTEVINAYLKDNKELDNLLDNAYDNQIEKGKQKTKK